MAVFSHRRPLSARMLNQVADAARRGANSTTGGGIGSISGPSGTQSYSGRPRRFIAELRPTGSDSGASGSGVSGTSGSGDSGDSGSGETAGRAFVEVVRIDGEYVAVDDGYSSDGITNALYDINDIEIPLTTNGHPTRVEAWPTPRGDAYECQWGGGGGSGPVVGVVTCVQYNPPEEG